jgi:hypothetical protein
MSRGFLWDSSHRWVAATSICNCGLTKEQAFRSDWVLDEHWHPVPVGSVVTGEAGSVEVVAHATD